MKVAVVMGSKSDYPKVQEGIELLEKFGVKVTTSQQKSRKWST